MPSSRRPVLLALGAIWNRITTPQRLEGVWNYPHQAAQVRISDWRRALQVPAIFRCVSVISQSIAMLPWNVLKQDDDDSTEKLPSAHPIVWLLKHKPNPETKAFDFKAALLVHALTQGNGYAEIVRNGRGQPIELWLIDDPDRVTPGRDANGALAYKIQQADGGAVILGARDVFHLKGLTTDGIRGLGILELAARSVGVSIALDQVTERYFSQGLRTPGFMKLKGKGGIEALRKVNEFIKEQFTGLQNFHRPVPIDDNMEFQPAGSTLDDAQFIDMRKFAVTDWCRWYGVPPHMVMDLDKATYSNIESQGIDFLNLGLLPRIIPMEQEADFKLLTDNWGGLQSKVDTNAITRGDMAQRIAYYQGMRNMGVYTVNDILGSEGRSTIGPEGDVRVMQMQYQPTAAKPGADPSAPPTSDDPSQPKPNGAIPNGAAH